MPFLLITSLVRSCREGPPSSSDFTTPLLNGGQRCGLGLDALGSAVAPTVAVAFFFFHTDLFEYFKIGALPASAALWIGVGSLGTVFFDMVTVLCCQQTKLSRQITAHREQLQEFSATDHREK